MNKKFMLSGLLCASLVIFDASGMSYLSNIARIVRNNRVVRTALYVVGLATAGFGSYFTWYKYKHSTQPHLLGRLPDLVPQAILPFEDAIQEQPGAEHVQDQHTNLQSVLPVNSNQDVLIDPRKTRPKRLKIHKPTSSKVVGHEVPTIVAQELRTVPQPVTVISQNLPVFEAIKEPQPSLRERMKRLNRGVVFSKPYHKNKISNT